MKILTVDNLFFTANDKEILKGISLDVNKGDCISIIGISGSGKSTLLKLMADLIPITTGDIKYKNKSYKEYNPIELRRSISYCIQIPYLFGEKVIDNLEFPFKIRNEEIGMDNIVKLLEVFNLNEEYLNKDIIALSGGEKQRISIIRNLLYTPDVLLLDEATSALDMENGMLVEKYIKKLNKLGVTVIWITHNIEQSTRIFNKRIHMESGKIEKMEVF